MHHGNGMVMIHPCQRNQQYRHNNNNHTHHHSRIIGPYHPMTTIIIIIIMIQRLARVRVRDIVINPVLRSCHCILRGLANYLVCNTMTYLSIPIIHHNNNHIIIIIHYILIMIRTFRPTSSHSIMRRTRRGRF